MVDELAGKVVGALGDAAGNMASRLLDNPKMLVILGVAMMLILFPIARSIYRTSRWLFAGVLVLIVGAFALKPDFERKAVDEPQIEVVQERPTEPVSTEAKPQASKGWSWKARVASTQAVPSDIKGEGICPDCHKIVKWEHDAPNFTIIGCPYCNEDKSKQRMLDEYASAFRLEEGKYYLWACTNCDDKAWRGPCTAARITHLPCGACNKESDIRRAKLLETSDHNPTSLVEYNLRHAKDTKYWPGTAPPGHKDQEETTKSLPH